MQENLSLQFDNKEFENQLFGNFDLNIKIIENTFNINAVLRDDSIVLVGENPGVSEAGKIINQLYTMFEKTEKIDQQMIHYLIDIHKDSSNSSSQVKDAIETMDGDTILFNTKGAAIKPKTLGQIEYVNNIKKSDVSICVGPAGTGKTYLAVAMAVRAFKAEQVNRIILTRPAVEAGESLGFLPGDLKDKVDPYLRPLYDALFEMMGPEKFAKLMERGVLEVAPLAFMRGRTLDNSFIILDEAQNTTREQMKMFLTRLGFGSKMVITGDITQIDLPNNKKSGLLDSVEILKDIEGISINYLTEKDVVRHMLVQKIIKAYVKHDKKLAYKESVKQKKAKNQLKKNRIIKRDLSK